jgi:hypothetical protein
METISTFCKSRLAFLQRKIPWGMLARTCEKLIVSVGFVYYCVKDRISRISTKIVENPITISVLAFLVSTIVVIALTIKFSEYNAPFFQNILVEAHGMLFDILVIGIFILWLNKRGEKRLENKRYQEEIDDTRGWESAEASYRIAGNIRRLSQNGSKKIDIEFCYLGG